MEGTTSDDLSRSETESKISFQYFVHSYLKHILPTHSIIQSGEGKNPAASTHDLEQWTDADYIWLLFN